MTFKSLSYVSEEAITAERDDGSFRLIEPSDADLWELATSGELGEVAKYVPPPEPTDAERLAEWRAVARCDMLALQDCLIDIGLWQAAENAAATIGEKWRIRWQARGGIGVFRSAQELDGFAEMIGLTAGQVDALPMWVPPCPEGLIDV